MADAKEAGRLWMLVAELDATEVVQTDAYDEMGMTGRDFTKHSMQWPFSRRSHSQWGIKHRMSRCNGYMKHEAINVA